MPMLQFVAATMLDTLYPYQRLCLCQHIYILMDSRGFLTIGLTISLMVTNSSNFVFFSCLLASFAHTLQAMLIHIKGWFFFLISILRAGFCNLVLQCCNFKGELLFLD